MNYTLFTEKILSIARSLAAMQLLADHDGERTGYGEYFLREKCVVHSKN